MDRSSSPSSFGEHVKNFPGPTHGKHFTVLCSFFFFISFFFFFCFFLPFILDTVVFNKGSFQILLKVFANF